MRSKILIIYTLFAFALLPTLVGNVLAQTNIVEINSTMMSKRSIVREYSRNLYLVYNKDNQFSFNLIDVSTGVCNTFYLPSLSVNDFEIADDTAYFCGNIGANVVVGWFDIQNLFFNGGVMSCTIVPTTLPCNVSTSCTEEILSLDKLEIIEYADGFNHLVMIGKATCTMSSTVNTCIAELYYDGLDYKLAYQVEHLGIFGYDDIAITREKVIVIGHKRESNGEYMTAFDIPASNMDMISSTTPYSPGNYYTYSSGSPNYSPHFESELLIEAIPGTTYFATICQAMEYINKLSYVDGTYFNLYSDDSTLIYQCKINDYHSLTYKEMKYNRYTNSFFLLMEDCETNMHNGYYEFALDNTWSFVTNVYFHQDLGYNTYVSLDRCTMLNPNHRCVLSGYDNDDKLNIWYHDINAQNLCSETVGVPHFAIQNTLALFYYNYPRDETKLVINIYSDRIFRSELTIICDE